MKRPAFQFYPADWRKDMALQSCSVAARGLWMDILCIAHECEPYGHLTVNGKPMTAAQIGRHTGLTQRECEKLLQELTDAGVSSVSEDGAIYSRRMVRDEDLRNRRAEGGKAGSEHGAKGAEHGAKGGRPQKSRGVSEPPSEPPPSSSSSASADLSKPTASHPPAGGKASRFDEFWQAWPKNERKQDRKACAAKWKLHGFDALADVILADVRLKRGTRKWAEGFIEAPLVYLNNRRWEDGVVPGEDSGIDTTTAASLARKRETEAFMAEQDEHQRKLQDPEEQARIAAIRERARGALKVAA